VARLNAAALGWVVGVLACTALAMTLVAFALGGLDGTARGLLSELSAHAVVGIAVLGVAATLSLSLGSGWLARSGRVLLRTLRAVLGRLVQTRGTAVYGAPPRRDREAASASAILDQLRACFRAPSLSPPPHALPPHTQWKTACLWTMRSAPLLSRQIEVDMEVDAELS